MNFAVAARFIGALIDLIVLEKQLDILELAKDAAYDLANRQVTIAEALIIAHCTLLEKVSTYYGIANSAPVYSQQYECNMAIANTDVIREANRAMNQQIDTTDMYSAGLRRDFVESAMSGIVFGSSGQWAMAYRNEDDLNQLTQLRRVKHMVDSVNANNLFIASGTFNRLGQDTVNLAASTSRIIESHLESFVTGVTDLVSGPNRDVGSSTSISTAVANPVQGQPQGAILDDRVLRAEPLPANNNERRIRVLNGQPADPVVTQQSLNPEPTRARITDGGN